MAYIEHNVRMAYIEHNVRMAYIEHNVRMAYIEHNLRMAYIEHNVRMAYIEHNVHEKLVAVELLFYIESVTLGYSTMVLLTSRDTRHFVYFLTFCRIADNSDKYN
jgi:hypothetical protein